MLARSAHAIGASVLVLLSCGGNAERPDSTPAGGLAGQSAANGGSGVTGGGGVTDGGGVTGGGVTSGGVTSGGVTSGGVTSGGDGGAAAATPREREILAPLGTPDGEIAAVSGRALFTLARSIGLARGYAMCRCAYREGFLDPMPYEVESLFETCAEDESGSVVQHTDDAHVGCLLQKLSKDPWLEEALRCHARALRADGLLWRDECNAALGGKRAPFDCPFANELNASAATCRP